MTFPPPPQQPAPTQAPGFMDVPGPPKKASRRKAWLTYGVTALVSLLIGAGIGGQSESGAKAATPGSTGASPAPAVTVTETAEAKAAPAVTETVVATVTAEPEETEEAGPATSISGEGEYLVGEDIKAGTYKSAGPSGDFGCYWARLKDASGEFDAIIANNNLSGPGRVTLNKGEYFQTTMCQEWTRVG
ncbi:hypothetical protein OG778_30365 [Streptomyces sp. NBC_00184]|uniref:hypothetical protein n=1 Tax=Streptomyces sp. NBC_00184 TaxID=2975673 RepID=UPI002E2C5035|nr:hypothetical protein [Streptomyces sp. NBC_00184]